MNTTCVVTATICDPSQTNLLGNSLIRFRLRNFTGSVPQVSGTCVIVEDTIDAYPSPAGVISQVLVCNTAISPVNTFYTCEMWNQGRIISSANYIFNANTSLNTASPINPAPAPAGPSSIIFKNNGVLNSSQTLLNLENTDGSVIITDLGGGNIDLQAAASGFDIPGVGGFWSAGFPMQYIFGGGVTSGGLSNVANQVYVWQFILNNPFTISRVSIQVVNGTAGTAYNVGIYSEAGNKLLDSGPLAGTSSVTGESNVISPVNLPAGVYYLAGSVNTTNGGTLNQFTLGAAGTEDLMNANGSVKIGQASNPTVAGVMPAALGAIAADTQHNNMFAAFFGV